MEYTIDYSLQKLRKVAKKTLDPLRGMHSYFYVLRKIFLTIENVIIDINHEKYQEAEDLLISLLGKKWHNYLRYCSYCLLAHSLKKGNQSPIIRTTIDRFREDISNSEIIKKVTLWQKN